MKSIRSWLASTWFWPVFGVIVLAALIWWASPLLGNVRTGASPFEPAWVRALLIVGVVVLLLGRKMLVRLRSIRIDRRLLDSIARPQAHAEVPAPSEIEVARRFERAIGVLKQTRLRANARGPAAWFDRTFVYQLPWYVIVGAPGSGKTTVLEHSGLRFPLAEPLGKEAIGGVGGTRHCEWWFTDKAVLIDTAGRYATQDSQPKLDSAEWAAFTRGLARHRPRQALNGAIVTVSIADLITSSTADRERQASSIRARLGELSATLGHELPVYVLVTKADLLAGFQEFFGDYERDRRDQPWGFDFPYRAGAAAGFSRTAFASAFDDLVGRIEALTASRLQSARDQRRRIAIAGFSRQLELVRDALGAYLDAAVGDTRFSHPVVVRGVFLTSGTQLGTPFDRMVDALARSFGVGQVQASAQSATGKSFFVREVLERFVFEEADLVGASTGWEVRRRRVRMAAVSLTGVAAAVMALLWTASYFSNRGYVEAVDAQAARMKGRLATRSVGPASPLTDRLALLSELRGLAVANGIDPANPPTRLGWGLFQGDELGAGAAQTYRSALAMLLEPVLVERSRAALAMPGASLDARYESLRTYLLLHVERREGEGIAPRAGDAAVGASAGNGDASRATLLGWLEAEARSGIGRGLPESARAELVAHGSAWIDGRAWRQWPTADPRLIAAARAELSRDAFPSRVYRQVLRDGLGRGLPDFTVSGALASARVTGVVVDRLSGRPLTEGVPARFTAAAYSRQLKDAIRGALPRLAAEESWVLGLADSPAARLASLEEGREALEDDVRTLYLQDYAATWQKFVDDLTVRRAPSNEDAIRSAREVALILAGDRSPLAPLLTAIVKETTLTGTADSVFKRVVRAGGSLIDSAGVKVLLPPRVLPLPVPGGPVEQLVDDRFADLRRFVTPPVAGQPPRVDEARLLFRDIHAALSVIEPGRSAQHARDLKALQARGAAFPEPVRRMVAALTSEASSAVAQQERRETAGEMSGTVTRACTQALRGRYPFSAGARADVTVDDFTKLFGRGGVLDDFFQKRLAGQVDFSTNPWRLREGSLGQTGVQSAALVEFQRAATIRDAFFPQGATNPVMRASLRLVDADPAVKDVRLDVDGQVAQFSRGSAVPQSVAWPGPRGTGQIRMVVVTDAGESTLVVEGPWAMLRLFDPERARVTTTPQPERFRASYLVDGKRLEFEVTGSGVNNPLRLRELREFSCPANL